MVGEAPESERLKLAFRDHDRKCDIAQRRRISPRHDVKHVGAARRAQIFLPWFEIAGGIVFEVRLVSAQSVLANIAFARTEVRNDDAGIVPTLSADNLTAR